MASNQGNSLWINLELSISCENEQLSEEAFAAIAQELKKDFNYLEEHLKKTGELSFVSIKDVFHRNRQVYMSFDVSCESQLYQLFKGLESRDNKLSKHLTDYFFAKRLDYIAGVDSERLLICDIRMTNEQFHSCKADLCHDVDTHNETPSTTMNIGQEENKDFNIEGNVRKQVNILNKNSTKQNQPGSYQHSGDMNQNAASSEHNKMPIKSATYENENRQKYPTSEHNSGVSTSYNDQPSYRNENRQKYPTSEHNSGVSTSYDDQPSYRNENRQKYPTSEHNFGVSTSYHDQPSYRNENRQKYPTSEHNSGVSTSYNDQPSYRNENRQKYPTSEHNFGVSTSYHDQPSYRNENRQKYPTSEHNSGVSTSYNDQPSYRNENRQKYPTSEHNSGVSTSYNDQPSYRNENRQKYPTSEHNFGVSTSYNDQPSYRNENRQKYPTSEHNSGESTSYNDQSTYSVQTIKKKFLLYFPNKNDLIIKQMCIIRTYDGKLMGTMSPHSTDGNMFEVNVEMPVEYTLNSYKYVCKVENKSLIKNIPVLGGLVLDEFEITSTEHGLKEHEVQRDVFRGETSQIKDIYKFGSACMYEHLKDILFHCSQQYITSDCCFQIEAVGKTYLPISYVIKKVRKLAKDLPPYPAISTVLFVVVLGNLFKKENIYYIKDAVCTGTAKQVIQSLSKSPTTVNKLTSSCREYIHPICKAIYKIGFGDSLSQIQLLDACFNFYGDEYILQILQSGECEFKNADANGQSLTALYSVIGKLIDNGSTSSQHIMEYIVRRLPINTAIEIFSKMYISNSESSIQVRLYGSMKVRITAHLKEIKKYPGKVFDELEDLLVVLSKHDRVFRQFSGDIEGIIIDVVKSSSRDQIFGSHDVCINLLTCYELFSSSEAKQRLLNCFASKQNLYLLDIFKDLCSQWQDKDLFARFNCESFESFCESYIAAKRRRQRHSCSLETLMRILCELWDLSFVKQSEKMQHVLGNLTLKELQGHPFKSLFRSIDVIDRTTSSTYHISEAVLSHVSQQLLSNHETPESLLRKMPSAAEGPILQTSLSANVVNVILDMAGSLPDDVSVVEQFKHLVSKFQFWTLIFSCGGPFKEKICENLKYQRAKECILEVIHLFKRYEISYDFLKSMDKRQNGDAKRLMKYWMETNEVEMIWLELECNFKKYVEKCSSVERVINTFKKNEPRFTDEFSHFLCLVKKYLHDLETGNLNARGCRESLFWRDIEELVESCEKLSSHVQSEVFWNTCRNDVYEGVHALYQQEDPLWSIRHLYQESFFEDNDFKSIFLCQSYALNLFQIGCSLYHQNWFQLKDNVDFTMQGIRHMFGARPDVKKEVTLAQAILHVRIDIKIVNALKRIYSIDSIAETVTHIEHLFSLFEIDSNRDIKCQEALTAFRQLLKGTAQKSTFLEVRKSLETVFKLVGILTPRACEILNVLVKASTLIEFLRSIVDEDIKNLIDAVEDISEQQVQESTVSALIEVKQFLQPMLVFKDDWKCVDILDLIQKQTLFYGANAVMLPHKIDDCVQNVHNLRSLYNGLANRSEQTKEVVRKIMLSGEYHFHMNANYSSVEFEVAWSQNDADDIRKQSTLIDLRSRALLLMNTFKKEMSKDQEDGIELESFVRDVDICLEIIEILFNLHTAGHVDFKTIEKIIKSECLKQVRNNLQDILDKWQTILDDVRHTHYLMNFIDGNQLHNLYEYLVGQANVEQAVQLIMTFIHPDLNALKVKEIYEEIASTPNMENKCMLLCIGDAIHRAYAGLNVCQRTINIDRNRISDLVQQGKLSVVQLEEGSLHTVKTLLSLYINTTRCLPEASQVLFCRRDTSWAELDLIVKRCVGADKFYKKKTLFCVAHVENLPGELQFRLVEKLHQLDRDSKFLLAVICRGSRNHPFVDELSDCISTVKPATDRTVEDIFATHCSEVYTLTSNHAGQGKSTYIRSVAHRQQMGLVRFHISGQLAKSVLVERLNSLDMKKHHMLHIDIGSVDEPSELDTFLFELVVLKYVSAGRKAVKLVSEHVFIELANSIGDTLRKSLHTTVLFQRKEIDLSGIDRLVASKELNSPVQIVCFYLKHLDEGTLDGTDLTQSNTIYKPLSGKRCKTLLLKFIFKERNESFPVVHTIINVLADQFKKMSKSSFFKVSRLREMVGNKSPISITSKLVKAMIEVGTEFATRSVQSCRQTQSTTVNRDPEEHSLAKSAFSTKIANITDGMIRWEDSNHMLFVFHNQNINTLSALYRHLTKVPDDIKNLFESQMKKKMVDFNTLTQNHFQDLLQKIARVNPFPLQKTTLDEISQNYALTADNLLKMVLIMLRIKASIPVLVMGETGCGKTSLIRYLASVCEVKFEVFNIHAGIPEEDIVGNVLQNNSIAMKNMDEERWLFLDEINTSDSIGLISDAICHHSCLGCELSPNLVVMGACNPYKLRTSKDISTAGLEGKVKTDELSRLVYRVLPLPEIMVDYVWDFGSLNEKDEEMYIHRMIQDVFPNDRKNHNLFTSLLSLSQVFVRGHEKSQYSVSLRDVQRCRLLAKWFLKVLPKKKNIERNLRLDVKLKSMILSLAVSYHARFSSKSVREEYRHAIGDLFSTNGMKMDDDQGSFIHTIIKEEQTDILRRMKLPTGIARNTALQENVFVILVCIFNRIPIFVVGKPGCSKSLAMQLIRSNLRGKDSEDDFFKTLPQLYCVSFQGSESSTSDGIIKVFKKAESYQDANKSGDVLSVVVLDEIGLAEISRFNPLKVLHSLLEPDGQNQPNVAVVGISNWSLDASKMNRAIHLSRPDMDEEELFDTATSISESFLGTENKVKPTWLFEDTHIERHLPSDEFNKILKDIAAAYFQYIQQLRFKHFHGLRDYYSLVKYVAKEYADADNESIEIELADIIVHGIARNFGGLPEEIHTLYDVFSVHITSISSHQSQQSPLLELVTENIMDPLARHLMLITTGESVLGILEQKLNDLGSRQREIIFGSQFDEDLTDDYNYRILSRIILCMEQGMILVLKDLDNIYGSLYDMLNQNYTIIGKKKNCRVALGPYSNPICHVADHFRCIVLVDESMLDLSDPPFLNRFEKQYLRFSDIIEDKHSNFIETLENWIGQLTKEQDKSVKINALFPINNKDLLASVVLKIEANVRVDILEHNIIEECKNHLLQIMKPDAVVRLQRSSVLAVSDREKLVEQYFGLPIHNGLEHLMIHQLNHSPDPVLESGILSVVFTNSNIHTKIKCNKPEICAQIEKIGTFKSEKQLSSRIQLFWDDGSKSHLIIQCNAKDEGHHILLTKLVVERCRNDYLLKATEDRKHVYLIIHIDQNNTSQECLSQLNFLSDWTMFMLDCLECPRITLPSLCQMSLIDAINERRPLISDLKEELLWAFSRIRYDKLGRSVDSISNALSSIEGSDKLMDMLEMEIIDWLQRQHGLARNRYWACEVASNITSLKSSSGFIDALEQYIKDKIKLPFAKLIFQIESMSLLESFFVAGCEEEQSDVIIEKRSKWMYCLRNKCVLSLEDIVDESGPECYTCSSHDCQLRMPCSKTIFDAIEATRNEFMDLLARYKLHCLLEEDEQLPSEVYDEVLNQQEHAIVEGIPDLNEFTYTNWSSDYLEDFCSLTLDAVLVGTFKSECKPFLLQYLDRHDIKFNNDSFGFVIRLHTIVWAHFDSIRAELLLLDHFLSERPECKSDLLKIMSEDELNNGGMKDSDYSDMFSDEITYSSDVHDFSNVSIESGENENAAKVEDSSMKVSERLVYFVCKKLLPSNHCVKRHKGITNWTLIVNETLPLAAQVSRETHTLYSLKVCSEIAENFINYFNMNVELLENMGQSLLKHSLDSDRVYDAIIRLIDTIRNEKTLKDDQKLLICYQTLSSYLVRCISANPDTAIFSKFFKYIAENRINSQYFLLFKVPFKTLLRTIDVQMFVNLLSNVNFMDQTNFENSPDELDETDKHLLQSVDHMIVGLLEKTELEMPVLALLVDVLVDIFNERLFSTVLGEEKGMLFQSEKNENEFDEQDLTKLFYECHKSLKYHKPGLNYIASIAFCKCFTHYSSEVIESRNDEKIVKIMNVLRIVHNDLLKNGLPSLACFLFKVLLQKQTVMQIQKNCFSNAKSLKFNDDEMFDFSSRNVHNSILCTYVDKNVHKNLCFCWQDISSSYKENICELATSSMKNKSGMIQLFAFIVRDFFLSKIIDDHDDSKRTLADLLVNEVMEKGHDKYVTDYVQCLIGRKDFHIREFGIEQTSSQREICMFSFIVNLITLILANDKYTPCQHNKKSFLTKALLEPESLTKLSMPGFCPQVLTKSVPSTLYTGICVCRNKVFTHKYADQNECPVCGNDIILTKYEYPSAFRRICLDKNMLADDNNFATECVMQFLVKSCLLGSVATGYTGIDKIHASFNFTWTKSSDALLKELIQDWDTVGRFVNINDNDTAILMNALLLAANDMLFSTCESCLSSENTNNFELRFAAIVDNVFGDKTAEIQNAYSKNNHLHQQDGSQRQFNDQVFEVNDLSTISAHDLVIQLPQLYRLTAYASEENFVFEINRRKHEFPFLMTVLRHRNILSLPKHIMNILSWHSTTVAYASYMMKKHDCVKMPVLDFLYYNEDSVKSNIAKSRFENFKESLETVRDVLQRTDLPRIHSQTKMEECLILNEQSVMYEVLLTLIHIQNRFLDDVGDIANASLILQGMSKKNKIYLPCVPLLELKKDDLLDTKLDLDSILQEESQSDLRYGHGTKVHYDFYRIEEYLAKEFVNGKKYITAFDNLPNIIFIDELHLNYSSLVKEIKGNVSQVPLSADICNGIMRRKEDNPRMPSDLLTHLGIVMTIVKEFKANPEQPLVEFVDSWKSLMCRKFPKELIPSPESCIQLCHIVALSELLEEFCADYIRDGLSDEYRDSLDPSLRDHLVKLLKDEDLLSLLFKALKRFVYRCLASATADSRQSLRHYLSDESFWPNEKFLKGSIHTTRKKYLILDVLPDGLMVRHVADTIDLIDEENKKRTKGNTKLSGFASSFQQKPVSAANKRTVQKKKMATTTRKF